VKTGFVPGKFMKPDFCSGKWQWTFSDSNSSFVAVKAISLQVFADEKNLGKFRFPICSCGLITILSIKTQNRQSFRRFIKVQKYGFQVQKMSLLFQGFNATPPFLGHFPRAKYLIFLKQLSKYILLILQFYFQSTKLTLLFNSKQSKRFNKYFKRHFLEIQEMKYTQLQEKVRVFADIKIKGEK
jgi:hypothetical protein